MRAVKAKKIKKELADKLYPYMDRKRVYANPDFKAIYRRKKKNSI